MAESQREKLIQAARNHYEPANAGELEVDDDAELSRSDNGWWVQAWVFVHDEEIEES
jgi:hypothetical protein